MGGSGRTEVVEVALEPGVLCNASLKTFVYIAPQFHICGFNFCLSFLDRIHECEGM